MKNTVLIIFLILISNILSAQSGWIVYKTCTDSVLNDIIFVNPNTGWAVGHSAIIKTTNGGVNWKSQNFSISSTYSRFHSVKFVNENTGYIVGGHFEYSAMNNDYYCSYFLKTTNGGTDWITVSSSNGSSEYCYCVHPVNKDTLYLTQNGNWFQGTSGVIEKSYNGGNTFPSHYSDNCHFYSIYFINYFTGWVSAYSATDVAFMDCSFLYKTTNAGANWFIQRKDSSNINASRIYNIMFVDENTGYALGQRSINEYTRFFKTTNGGINWLATDYIHCKNRAMFFINHNTGWIGGGTYPDSSGIDYTTNGGINWVHQIKNINMGVSKLFFINSLTGWGVEYNGSNIFKTTTGGSTYIKNYSNKLVKEYKLYQNYPNPFNSETKIRFSLKESGFVTLKIYNILGKELESLVNEKLSRGVYEVSISMNDLSSGVYYYRLEANGYSSTKKLILLK